jgi:hypothetical protein
LAVRSWQGGVGDRGCSVCRFRRSRVGGHVAGRLSGDHPWPFLVDPRRPRCWSTRGRPPRRRPPADRPKTGATRDVTFQP